MKPANYRLLLSFCLLLLCGHVSVAQKKEPLRADWLASDIANLERILPQLKQNEPLTVAALDKIFVAPGANRIDWPRENTRLGFGAQTFTFSKPGGYTSLRVTGWVFNDTIANYTIDLSTSSDSWSMIKSVLIDRWNRNAGPEFTEYRYGVYHEREFADVIADYKKAVANELGEMQPVKVPPHLKDGYEFLISVGSSAAIGDGGCGYGGSTPRGKEAMDAIVKARRVDLIVNILKGYNPGGRGYAMLALFGMMRKGLELSPDVQRAFDIVRDLDLELTTCSGCMYMNETAQQILNRWRF